MLTWINSQRRWVASAITLPMMLSVGAMAATDSTAKKDSMPAMPMAKDSAKTDTTKKDTAAAAAPAAAPTVGDPTGATTGTANDITAKVAGKPTMDEIAADLGHTKIAVNFTWMLMSGFLVFFMQAGFALLETGFVRAKNASHVMFMNISIYFIGVLGYLLTGYALQMGNVAGNAQLGGIPVAAGEFTIPLAGKAFGLWATQGFFLAGKFYDVGFWALFLFSVVFMDAACTIPTGAMAERWKTSNFILFGFVMSMIVYPLFGNWAWGNGWLSQLGANFGLGHGYVDFAGSTVVHMVGGVAALAGIVVLGPRIGKFTKEGKANAIPGHHIPMAVMGTLVLGFGWFGFNAGSTLAGTDLRLAVVAVNTMLASCWAGAVTVVYMKLKTGKWDVAMACNGYLAGLVAITAPCAFVNVWGSMAVGIGAGLVCPIAYSFIENVLKLDDAVGACAVHGAGGAWGGLSLGLFADGAYGEGWNGVKGGVRGLFYGDASQFVVQIIGVATCFVFVFGSFWIFFKVTDKIWGIRVSPEVEIDGLDMHDIGIPAYNDFTVHSN
jgi:Amt family ammonium transporter